MDEIIKSIRDSLRQENWYGALFVALTLPDILAALEHGRTAGDRYSQWFEANMPSYKGYLSGNDCYALRCSLLHQGQDDITHQRMKDILEHYVFISGSSSHCNLIRDCVFNGIKKSFLQLNVGIFCEDICVAAESWLAANANNPGIGARIADTIDIHEPSYVYQGAIQFN